MRFEQMSSQNPAEDIPQPLTPKTSAVIVSVVLTYLQFPIPDGFIKGYVGVVILLIVSVTLVQKYVGAATEYRPRWLIGFAICAGLNKGIAGSGYSSVITLGEIISGVYEKSATAITSMAEGIVSLAGIAAFFGLPLPVSRPI